MSEINFEELAKKVLEAVKSNPGKLNEVLQNNAMMKEILGDDGKLTADDFQRIAAVLQNQEAVKKILGDDGKFSMDDVTRLMGAFTGDAQEGVNKVEDAAKDILGKVGDLFNKKES